MPPSKAPIMTPWSIVRDAVLLFSAHWQRHFTLAFVCAVPFAILFAMGFFEPVISLRTTLEGASSGAALQGQVPALRLLSGIALFSLTISIYATGWWSALFGTARLSAQSRLGWLMAFAAVLTRILKFGVIVFGGLLCLEMVIGFLIAPILGALGLQQLMFFVVVAIQMLAVGGCMRLALALPAAVWGEDVSFAAAWQASKGMTVTLGVAVIALSVVVLGLIFVFGLILDIGSSEKGAWWTAVTALIASPINALLYALPFSILAVVFRQLREEEKL